MKFLNFEAPYKKLKTVFPCNNDMVPCLYAVENVKKEKRFKQKFKHKSISYAKEIGHESSSPRAKLN